MKKMKTVEAIQRIKKLHVMLLIGVSGVLLTLFKTVEIDRELKTNVLVAYVKDNAANTESKKIRFDHSVARDHPHAGALDENGAWPYVPDVTAVRRAVLQRIQELPDPIDPKYFVPLYPDSTDCQDAPGTGMEGFSGYKALREYVELDGPDPLPEETAPVEEGLTNTRDGHWQRYKLGESSQAPPVASRSNSAEVVTSPPRVLCALKTYEGNHHRVADIAVTWGWRCDGFLAASTKTVPHIGAVNLPHKGNGEYDNLWQKGRSMAAFMYDYFLDDFDYFLVADDDSFVIMENLRNYLLLLESQTGGRDAQPLYIGSPFSHVETYYNTGGCGYLWNRAALRRLVEDGLPYFFANIKFSGEDVMFGAVMAALHILPVDTSDAANRQRFFQDHIGLVAEDNVLDLYRFFMYSRGYRYGKNIISTQSIGFHRIYSARRFGAIVYNACPQGTVLGDAQNSTVPPGTNHGWAITN
jgi:hypothetical protein